MQVWDPTIGYGDEDVSEGSGLPGWEVGLISVGGVGLIAAAGFGLRRARAGRRREEDVEESVYYAIPH